MRRNPHETTAEDYERARRLRRDCSAYEQKLWVALRQVFLSKKIKFRRQQPINPYIADFACMRAKLLIELDGASHDTRQEYDRTRDAYMKKRGYQILRISNEEISRNLEGVVDTIVMETVRLLSGVNPLTGKNQGLASQAQVFASSPSRREENEEGI